MRMRMRIRILILIPRLLLLLHILIQSIWATKDSTIGQQALLGAEALRKVKVAKTMEPGDLTSEDNGRYERPRSARPLGSPLPLLTLLIGQLQEPFRRPG